MLADQRKEHYRAAGKPEPTGPQRRRTVHKDGSRKTHEHKREPDPDRPGKTRSVRCLLCRPARDTSAIRPAPGPRDWKPRG